MTWKFKSLADFGRAVAEIPNKHSDKSWTGETAEESLEFCAKGDTRHVAEAEKLLEKVSDSGECVLPPASLTPTERGPNVSFHLLARTL